jgi:hypothetical protein
MDAVTCMHLIEHLRGMTSIVEGSAQPLKSGVCVYFETPHPKSLALSSPRGKAAKTFTLIFFDDPTHLKPVAISALACRIRRAGMVSGNYWNLAELAVCRGVRVVHFFAPQPEKYTAQAHWLGWSPYLIARRP